MTEEQIERRVEKMTDHLGRQPKMSELKITTDHKWRNFKYANEVPPRVLASEFDYQNRDDVIDGFFWYRGVWYHIDQFMHTADPANPLREWTGYASDTYFSGVVIKISSDGERYQVGTYCS